MSLTVNLCSNSSPVEKIGKTLSEGQSFDCLLKADTSILRPTIIVSDPGVNLVGYNYMTIAGFGRSYFIDDIITKNNDIWEISGHVDVLETYGTQILNNSAIIKGTERTGINKYLHDQDAFVVNCKHKTDIIPFSSGLLDTGEFILITAGG